MAPQIYARSWLDPEIEGEGVAVIGDRGNLWVSQAERGKAWRSQDLGTRAEPHMDRGTYLAPAPKRKKKKNRGNQGSGAARDSTFLSAYYFIFSHARKYEAVSYAYEEGHYDVRG